MPGWIDTHIHATWYFNKDGRYEQGPGRGAVTTPQQAALYAEANMYATLMGGFTAVPKRGCGARRRSAGHDRIGRAARPTAFDVNRADPEMGAAAIPAKYLRHGEWV